MSKSLKISMDPRKKIRKAFPYSRKILEIYQKAQCQDCYIRITAKDVKAVAEKIKPLSDKEISKILESDSNDSESSVSVISPRSDTRLRKKENGMVLLPRSTYNEHPAKKLLHNKISKSKNSPKDKREFYDTPRRSSAKLTITKRSYSKHNSSIKQKENEPLGRGQRGKTPTSNKLKFGKPSFSDTPRKVGRPRKNFDNGIKTNTNNNEIEYQLVFVESTKPNSQKNTKPAMLSLCDLLNTAKLPSKIWEVERVPPLLVNNKSDATYNTIAAELDALMADTEPAEDLGNIGTNQSQSDGTPENSSTLADSAIDASQLEYENKQDDPSRNDMSKQDQLSTRGDTNKSENPSEPCHEDDPNKILSTSSTIKVNVPMEVDLNSQDISEKNSSIGEAKTFSQQDKMDIEVQKDNVQLSETQDILDGTVHSEENSKEEESSSIENKLDLLTSTVISQLPENVENIENKNLENEPAKVIEEFPSIMDLLNENPSNQLDEPKNTKGLSNKVEDILENCEDQCNKVEDIPSSSECIGDKPTVSKTEVKNTPIDELKGFENDNDTIRSVVFRRFSADKQTYDRLVIFQTDLEYTVKINNKEVELLGAPKNMTSTEDLQILLQIVDEVSLDSLIVICKN